MPLLKKLRPRTLHLKLRKPPAADAAPAEDAAPAADAGDAKHTKTSLTKMLEVDLVKLANEMGIEATVDDLKADTVQKVLDKQG